FPHPQPSTSFPYATLFRSKVSKPILTDFYRWIQACHAQVKDVRSLLSTATGCAIRHEAALLRFLEDGKLKVTNNHSERAQGTIADRKHTRLNSSHVKNAYA